MEHRNRGVASDGGGLTNHGLEPSHGFTWNVAAVQRTVTVADSPNPTSLTVLAVSRETFAAPEGLTAVLEQWAPAGNAGTARKPIRALHHLAEHHKPSASAHHECLHAQAHGRNARLGPPCPIRPGGLRHHQPPAYTKKWRTTLGDLSGRSEGPRDNRREPTAVLRLTAHDFRTISHYGDPSAKAALSYCGQEKSGALC